MLWNAVEENEKTKDSRLAREFVPALPVELTPAQWQELLSDFIQNCFVTKGMCVLTMRKVLLGERFMRNMDLSKMPLLKKPNRVGFDYYWLVDEDKNYFIGEISIRHRLTDDLKRYGGHIGYGIVFPNGRKDTEP